MADRLVMTHAVEEKYEVGGWQVIEETATLVDALGALDWYRSTERKGTFKVSIIKGVMMGAWLVCEQCEEQGKVQSPVHKELCAQCDVQHLEIELAQARAAANNYGDMKDGE